MNQLEITLNQYVKEILKLMYMEYKDFLGQEDDLLFFKLFQKEEVVRISSMSSFITIKDSMILISPSYLGKSEEEVSDILKQYIPFYLHAFFIHPYPKKELREEEMEFVPFFSYGLIEYFTRAFCQKYSITYINQYEPNFSFAQKFMNQIPKELRGYKEKMIFQNDVFYMCEVYKMHTGGDLIKKYRDNYLKEKDLEKLTFFCEKYSLPYVSFSTYKDLEKKMPEFLKEHILDETKYFSILQEWISFFSLEDKIILERKNKNGYLQIFFILSSCVFFGILFSMLLLR